MKILAQRPTHISAVATVLLITKTERQRQRERDRDRARETETETQRERDKETETDRQTDKEIIHFKRQFNCVMHTTESSILIDCFDADGKRSRHWHRAVATVGSVVSYIVVRRQCLQACKLVCS